MSSEPLGPDQVEIQFREGMGQYPARLSVVEFEAAMKMPTYLRSLREVNYWFVRQYVYGTYSHSLAPVDVLRFHNRKCREDWESFRVRALTAHGMDVTPTVDPDACDECGQRWILDLVWTTPSAEAPSTTPIPQFLCIDCERRRQTSFTSSS